MTYRHYDDFSRVWLEYPSKDAFEASEQWWKRNYRGGEHEITEFAKHYGIVRPNAPLFRFGDEQKVWTNKKCWKVCEKYAWVWHEKQFGNRQKELERIYEAIEA